MSAFQSFFRHLTGDTLVSADVVARNPRLRTALAQLTSRAGRDWLYEKFGLVFGQMKHQLDWLVFDWEGEIEPQLDRLAWLDKQALLRELDSAYAEWQATIQHLNQQPRSQLDLLLS